MTSCKRSSWKLLLLIAAASVISASEGYLQSSGGPPYFLSKNEQQRRGQAPNSSFTFATRSSSSSSSALFATKKKKKTSQSPKTANHEKWQPFYESLVQFQAQHGHCKVSFEDNPSLHDWLLQQHKSYELLKLGRKTKLTKKRAVALERIGAIPPELMT